MTLIYELKRIKTNQAQYGLNRETPKISALPLKELDKYEYLTGEDLGNKPGVAEKAKSEYYPLSKVINKELEKEGLLKRLRNIEDKHKKQ